MYRITFVNNSTVKQPWTLMFSLQLCTLKPNPQCDSMKMGELWLSLTHKWVHPPVRLVTFVPSPWENFCREEITQSLKRLVLLIVRIFQKIYQGLPSFQTFGEKIVLHKLLNPQCCLVRTHTYSNNEKMSSLYIFSSDLPCVLVYSQQ